MAAAGPPPWLGAWRAGTRIALGIAAGALALGAGALAVSALLPLPIAGNRARWIEPLFRAGPVRAVAWIVALVLAFPILLRLRRRPGGDGGEAIRLALAGAGVMAAITLLYAALAVPVMGRDENLRRVAGEVNAAVRSGGGGPLFVLAPGYQPFLFYLHPAPRYLRTVEQLPHAAETIFLLIKNPALADATAALEARGWRWQNVRALEEKNRGRYVLLQIDRTNSTEP